MATVSISVVQTLEEELAVALAERDQADAEVLRLEEELRILKLRLQERDFQEKQRLERWAELRMELQALREENERLRIEGSKHVATSQ